MLGTAGARPGGRAELCARELVQPVQDRFIGDILTTVSNVCSNLQANRFVSIVHDS